MGKRLAICAAASNQPLFTSLLHPQHPLLPVISSHAPRPSQRNPPEPKKTANNHPRTSEVKSVLRNRDAVSSSRPSLQCLIVVEWQVSRSLDFSSPPSLVH
mmetsp:Transcript_36684/g.54803  ORF Transcript_36684/g.54803 Transcript_36684/m.54803 type:complete len:101 (+) Transcript_36684:327-629(+)